MTFEEFKKNCPCRDKKDCCKMLSEDSWFTQSTYHPYCREPSCGLFYLYKLIPSIFPIMDGEA